MMMYTVELCEYRGGCIGEQPTKQVRIRTPRNRMESGEITLKLCDYHADLELQNSAPYREVVEITDYVPKHRI